LLEVKTKSCCPKIPGWVETQVELFFVSSKVTVWRCEEWTETEFLGSFFCWILNTPWRDKHKVLYLPSRNSNNKADRKCKKNRRLKFHFLFGWPATGWLMSQRGKDVYDFLSSSPCFDNRNGNEGMISVLDFLFYPKVGMLQEF
jgi:hypothetical protein